MLEVQLPEIDKFPLASEVRCAAVGSSRLDAELLEIKKFVFASRWAAVGSWRPNVGLPGVGNKNIAFEPRYAADGS